jgi:transcriptional regulator with XRE-family HTH domain
MTDLRKIVGPNVRAYRTALGLTQAELAEKAGIATNHLGLLEAGKHFPTLDVLDRLAAALNKDALDFFMEKPIFKKFQKDVLADIEALITERMKSLE